MSTAVRRLPWAKLAILSAWLIFWGHGASAQEFYLESSDSCMANARVNGKAVIVLLDRSTILDQSAKMRWKDGISKIVSSQKIYGEFYVKELRDTSVGMRSISSGCLEDFRSWRSRIDAVRFTHSPMDWLSIQLEYNWKVLVNEVPDEKAENDKIWREKSLRQQYISKLTQVGFQDEPTIRDTEIAQSLANVLQSSCMSKAECRIYIFTDLLDSKAKKEIRQSNVKDAGRKRAEEFLVEMRPDIHDTVLQFVVWGFGRSDARPGMPLDDYSRRQLRNYWLEYFNILCANARAGSFVDIRDEFNEP